jgi:hypothetical protein
MAEIAELFPKDSPQKFAVCSIFETGSILACADSSNPKGAKASLDRIRLFVDKPRRRTLPLLFIFLLTRDRRRDLHASGTD